MKSYLIVLLFLFSGLTLNAQSCNNGGIVVQGDRVEPWPWSVAQPFPWDNIEGYWQVSDSNIYIKATVTPKAVEDLKLLKLMVYSDGVCSKPTAQGRGFISAAEKNVVTSIMLDSTLRYRFKLGSFQMKDLAKVSNQCKRSLVMAASMQVIGHAPKSNEINTRLDPSVTELQKMILNKVNVDPSTACKK